MSPMWRLRKAKVHCGACGDEVSYTFSRLMKGICRNCKEPLCGISYEKGRQYFEVRSCVLRMDRSTARP